MSKSKLIIIAAAMMMANAANAQSINLKKVFSKPQNTTTTAPAAAADEFEVSGVRYKANGTEAIVVAKKYSGDIYIPKTVSKDGKTMTVTKIGDRAFAGCKKLRSINMSDAAIKEIGNGAFSGCMFLECASLPNTVVKIGDDAFHMTNIGVIELPASLKTLGKRAFFFSAIRSISLPNGLTAIDSRTFSGCADLKEITLPASVTSIAADAFDNSPNLKNINVAASNKVYTSSTDGKIHKK